MKNKLIILAVLVLIGGAAFHYYSNNKEALEIPVGNTPETPVTPAAIVPENPEGEADPNVMKLDMKTWQWISVTHNDGTKIMPKNADKFGLTFKNDGTFSASTDCNSIGGSYKVTGQQIVFSNMMMTLMFCTESQETEFIKVLEETQSFFFTSRGELVLDLKFDSGSAIFR